MFSSLHTAEVTRSQADNENESCHQVCAKINSELSEIARRVNNSVLRGIDFDGLTNFTFGEVINEMKTYCPTFYQLLSAMIETDNDNERKEAASVLIYAIIMFKRCHELSKNQRVNTFLLIKGGAAKEVLNLLYSIFYQ